MKNSTPNSFIKRYMPRFLRDKFSQHEGLKKITVNIGWLFFDKFLRMGIGLYVGVMVARYLAPQRFGAWNYALAFSSLFAGLSILGLDRIAVRELVKRPREHNEILGTLFVMRFVAGIVIVVISSVLVYFINDKNIFSTLLVAICSCIYIFQSALVIDYYYQSEVKSKYTVIAQNVAFIVSGILKLVLVALKAPLLAFVLVVMFEMMLASILLVITYKINGHSIVQWKFKRGLISKFLSDSWPYIVSGLAIMVYMRIDQIMVGNMLNDYQLGLYSVAVKISELWFFIPLSVVRSLFPAIVKSRDRGDANFLPRMQKLCDLLTYFGVIVALGIGFFSDTIISILYGQDYAGAGPVLKLHIWAGVVICLSATGSAWITAENQRIITIVKAITGALTNVVLNIIWIPAYGISGAAAATVCAQVVASMVFYNKKTWKIVKLELKTIFFVSSIRFIIGVLRGQLQRS